MTTEEFKTSNLKDWHESLHSLFNGAIPKLAVWDEIHSIERVLRHVARPGLNHMFYPEGGGNDLEAVKSSVEADCLELTMGGNVIVKPKRLLFGSFGRSKTAGAFFFLELKELQESGVYESLERSSEPLAELSPGEYGEYSLLDHSDDPLPATARGVARFFRGNFVLTAKASPYNLKEHGIRDPYVECQHNKMSFEQFSRFIGEHLP